MSHLGLTQRNYATPQLLKHFVEQSPPIASRLELWWVKLWGVKRVSTDWKIVVTTYYYGGKFYVTSIEDCG